MNKKIILPALIICTLFVFNAYAEDYPSFVKSAQAKYAKFQDDVKDMVMTQDTVMFSGGSNMPVSMKTFMKGNKFRSESTMAMPQTQGAGAGTSMNTIIINDGVNAWMITPYTGKQKLDIGQSSQYKEKSNWWAMIDPNAVITGTENVSGKTCYIIESHGSDRYPFAKIWVDKDKYTLVKAETNSLNSTPMTSVLSNFKEIKAGWEIPHKIDVYQGGNLVSTSMVKSLEINNGLSDELFDASKVPAQEYNMQDYMKNFMQEKK